jgi:hypothetical protein
MITSRLKNPDHHHHRHQQEQEQEQRHQQQNNYSKGEVNELGRVVEHAHKPQTPDSRAIIFLPDVSMCPSVGFHEVMRLPLVSNTDCRRSKLFLWGPTTTLGVVPLG